MALDLLLQHLTCSTSAQAIGTVVCESMQAVYCLSMVCVGLECMQISCLIL